MSEKPQSGVECKKCHRIVFEKDVDDKGRCALCQPDADKKPAAKKD